MRKVGKYLFLERLGAGGMGITFLAKAEGSQGWNRNFAVKQMLPEMAKFLDYFQSEAFIGGRLSHSNIVAVLDYFVDEEGRHNIVMEYIEGVDVSRLTDLQRRLAPPIAVYIARAALRGLAYVHNAYLGPNVAGPLVHRDLSPDNIMVSNGADVKIADFGIAKARGLWREETQADGFRGKLAYASPEQLRAMALDGRADVYQIGACLYEMLCGHKAFSGASSTYHAARVVSQIIEGEVRPLVELLPTIKPELAAAVATLMHCNRDRRPNAEEARALLKKACPECDDAEGELASIVRELTKKRRRKTSTWNVADLASPSPPPHVGAILTASPDMTTQKMLPAEAVAAVARHAASAKAPGVAPLPGVPVMEIHDEKSWWPAWGPAEVEQPRTKVLAPQPRRSKLPLRSAGWFALSLVSLLGAGAILYTAVHVRQTALQQPEAPPSLVAPPSAQPKQPTENTTAKIAPAAPAPAPSSPTQESKKKAKQERAADHLGSSPSSPCKIRAPKDAAAIIVEEEAKTVRVYVDGLYIGPAPIDEYLVDPGEHQVRLDRVDSLRGQPTTKWRVRVGHCYNVSRSPSAPRALSLSAPADPGPAKPPSPQKSYQQLGEEAIEAYLQGSNERARELARQSVKLEPRRKNRAYRIIAVTSCLLHDAVSVAEVWGHLDREGRNFVDRACSESRKEP